jgi:malate dehydrogenase (oxaloacetate-decarboxylating)
MTSSAGPAATSEATRTRDSEPAMAVTLSGRLLIDSALYNKGTAFTAEERRELGLLGFLPPQVESIETQVARAYRAYQGKPTDIERHIYLRQLQDENETLFYRLVLEHIEEMMPIVYTPVVGQACQQFSDIYRRPRGLFLAWPDRADLDSSLAGIRRHAEVIVVTDGERILGLGDQGAGGMGISIGKLSLYTLIGGVHPAHTLPIFLDAGTNNAERLNDPSYIGWRHERVTGQDYDDFIEMFVTAVRRRYPNALLQWEDFSSAHAAPILARYRDRLCTFNDDIQGTAAVATGTILAAMEVAGGRLTEQRFVMLGAGSAGIGIREQLIRTLIRHGLDEATAGNEFYVLDSKGLIHDGRSDLSPAKRAVAQPASAIATWRGTSLADVVHHARPTVLMGATGEPGVFTEAIIREMAAHTERPIVFPMSNPTSRAEAIPEDLLKWTDGRALVATGSPFAPVSHGGRTHVIAQSNNSYIFPAIGLAVRAAGIRRITDDLFMTAAEALKDTSPALHDPAAPLLPALRDIRPVARHIARAVALEAQAKGLAEPMDEARLDRRLDEAMWFPAYRRLVPA